KRAETTLLFNNSNPELRAKLFTAIWDVAFNKAGVECEALSNTPGSVICFPRKDGLLPGLSYHGSDDPPNVWTPLSRVQIEKSLGYPMDKLVSGQIDFYQVQKKVRKFLGKSELLEQRPSQLFSIPLERLKGWRGCSYDSI